MMLSILLISASILLIAYLLFARYKSGVKEESISETYYLLGDKGYLFTLLCFSVMILMIIPWIELSSGIWYLELLAFISCASLGFVGASPLFRDSTSVVHYTSAVVMCIASQLWIILEGNYVLTPLLLLLTLVYSVIEGWRHWMYWLEVNLFIFTVIYLISKSLSLV